MRQTRYLVETSTQHTAEKKPQTHTPEEEERKRNI